MSRSCPIRKWLGQVRIMMVALPVLIGIEYGIGISYGREGRRQRRRLEIE